MAAVVLLASLTSAAVAQPSCDGPWPSYEDIAIMVYGALERRDPRVISVSELEEREPEIRLCAEAGIPVSQYLLGFMYNWGYGVPFSREDQDYWYNAAADQAFPPAMWELAQFHRVEDEEAERLLLAAAEGGFSPAQFDLSRDATENNDYWLRLAAEGGHPDALMNLGSNYYNGDGVLQNKSEAARLWELAAARWSTTGMMWLGNMHSDGDGVVQDFVIGHMWYNIASAFGAEIGATRRDRLADRMTREQIAEAQRLAREWMAAHR